MEPTRKSNSMCDLNGMHKELCSRGSRAALLVVVSVISLDGLAMASRPMFARAPGAQRGIVATIGTSTAERAAPNEGHGAEEDGTTPINGEAEFPVSEIRRGQKGYGVSVFQGTSGERFELEVVGVLRNMNPGMDFVLARLSGQGLEQSGVIAGMSGSPVYIDDRLVGAVAFSWDFSTGALAGITPIGEMRRLEQLPGGGRLPASERYADGGALIGRLLARPALTGVQAEDNLLETLRAFFPQENASGSRPGWQFAVSGFGGRVSGMVAALVGGVATAGHNDDLPAVELVGGSSVAGVLLGGDLQMSVTGTVTERRGDEILAFGHPFLGLGPIELPMASAEVVSVVSSVRSSFKLSNVGPVIGVFDEDRKAGLRGRLGVVPKTTPMSIRVRGAAQHDFDIQVADFTAIRPMLVALSVLESLDRSARTAGDSSVDLVARFRLEGYPDLVINQNFDGSGAPVSAAIYVLQVVAFLELNDQVDVEIERIDVEATISERPRRLEILGAFADRSIYEPGEEVAISLRVRDYRGAEQTLRVPVAVPAYAVPGSYYVFVGEGPAIDAVRNQIEPHRTEKFEESLTAINALRSSADLAVILARGGDPGLLLEGRALPALPPSMAALIGQPGSARPKRLPLLVVQERSERFAQPLSGAERVDIKVRAKGDAADGAPR